MSMLHVDSFSFDRVAINGELFNGELLAGEVEDPTAASRLLRPVVIGEPVGTADRGAPAIHVIGSAQDRHLNYMAWVTRWRLGT